MSKTILELVVGNLEEKKTYRQFMKRVNALPDEYRYTFKKIQQYMYTLGSESCNMSIFKDLVDLFEASASENKPVLQVIGNDVASFCDELILASTTNTQCLREKLNQEILNYFDGEAGTHDESNKENT